MHSAGNIDPKLLADLTLPFGQDRDKQRVLFLDYDGTLTKKVNKAEDALLTNGQRLLLAELAHQENTHVWIVSGRRKDSLAGVFFDCPGIGLIAEHGAFIRKPHESAWSEASNEPSPLEALTQNFFQSLCKLIPGTHIENNATTVVWHFRDNIAEGSVMAPAIQRVLQHRLRQSGE